MAPKGVKFSEVPVNVVWCPPKRKKRVTREFYWFDLFIHGVTGIDLDKLGKRYRHIAEINDRWRALSYRKQFFFPTQTPNTVEAPLFVPSFPNSTQRVTAHTNDSVINLGPSPLPQKYLGTTSTVPVDVATVKEQKSEENSAGGILKGKSQVAATPATIDTSNPLKAMATNVTCPICKAKIKESDFVEHVGKMHSKPKDRYEGIPINTSISQLPAYTSQAQFPPQILSQYHVPMMMVPTAAQQWPYPYSAMPVNIPAAAKPAVTPPPVRPQSRFPTRIFQPCTLNAR
jgi:hypothetical protein